MLTYTTAAPVRDARPGYRPFRVMVERVRALSPHFTRVTFRGDDLDGFGTAGLDQRVKIVLPIPGVGLSDFGADDAEVLAAGTWYAKWRALDESVRNPFRTYTIRAVRPLEREVDVDFAVHGDGGPAARWLESARPGDEVVLVGPDAYSIHGGIGLDWHPGEARCVLLAGDETAAPAICAIVESLDPSMRIHAFVEVPTDRDALELSRNSDRVTWLGRNGRDHGSLLEPTVARWVRRNPAAYASALVDGVQSIPDVDVDTELLWDSPDDDPESPFYAWLAGEAAVIKRLRRMLVSETGIDRRHVAFMGYWRLGRPEAQ